MNKREYAEFHKYIAMLIYEYNKILTCSSLSDKSRSEVEDILLALEKVMKICIIGDKEWKKFI